MKIWIKNARCYCETNKMECARYLPRGKYNQNDSSQQFIYYLTAIAMQFQHEHIMYMVSLIYYYVLFRFFLLFWVGSFWILGADRPTDRPANRPSCWVRPIDRSGPTDRLGVWGCFGFGRSEFRVLTVRHNDRPTDRPCWSDRPTV